MTEKELLEFLGNQPNNELNLPDLAKQVGSGTGIIPFVGAGMSAPHLPQWGQFLREAARNAQLVEEVEGCLNRMEYEEAAELVRGRLGSNFQAMMERAFGDEAIAAANPRGAVNLIPQIATGLVITTNFDRLLEKVFLDAGCPFPVVAWHDKISVVMKAVLRNRLFLLKIHGDWEFTEERVFVQSEYKEQYGESRETIDVSKAVPRVFQLLATRPLLFLGCSLKQDRVGVAMSQLAEQVPTENFAILQFPGKEEYPQRFAELDRMHVRPIWYKTHDQIEQVLAYLAPHVPEPLRLVKKTSAPPADRLPRPDSTFVGRVAEQADLRALIAKYPLVTIVGGPGTGKTRLTIQVARSLLGEFDSIWFASLSQFSDAAALPQRIAHVMQLKGTPGADLLDEIAAALKPGRQMLILDSCETVLGECVAVVRKLRAACPDLHLVLTSRIELGNALPAGAEHLYRVPPLQAPDAERLPDLNALRKIDSVALLFERLRDPDSLRLTEANARDVARLCQGLDGVPLALELVAAQIDMRSLGWVIERWNQRLDFAGPVSDGVQEQSSATLRKSITLSADLLSKEPNGERLCRLFHSLSVFHRGWLAEAAHAVCGEGNETEDDVVALLKPLRRASLIEIEEVAGEKRYRYLDAIREFAAEELNQQGKAEDLRSSLIKWAIAFTERLSPRLLTNEQANALAKMIGEADNLRGAMLWANQEKDAEAALRLSTATWRIMDIKGFYTPGIARLQAALALAGGENLPALRSKALSGLSVLAYRQSDFDTAERASAESLKLEEARGDAAGIANALNDLGNVAQVRGEATKALKFYTDSLEHQRKIPDERGIAVGLFNCGRLEMNLGRLEDAAKNLQLSQQMFNQAGNRREEAFALNALGVLARYQGHEEEALFHAGRSLAIREELEDQRGVAETLRTKAAVLIGRRDFGTAVDLLRQSGETAIKIRDDRGLAETLEQLAWLASAQEQHAVAIQLSAAADKLRQNLRLPLPQIEKPALEAHLDAARRAQGDASYAAQWEKGEWTPPQEAFALGVNRKGQAAQTGP